MNILAVLAVLLIVLVVIEQISIVGAIVVFLVGWLVLTLIGSARGPRL